MSAFLDGKTMVRYTRKVLELAINGRWVNDDTIKRSVVRSYCLLSKEIISKI